ncbi:MAG: HAD-IA family hydrolase [Maritimibacter sp.]
MRTVIFDLDGTLVDSSADLIAAANSVFRDLGHGDLLHPVTDARTAFRGGRAMLKLGYGRLGLGEEGMERDYPALLEAYGQRLDVFTRLYPGAVAAVEALVAAGYAVGICTNKPEAMAEALLQSLGIRSLFGSLIGADTLATRKPDPAPYLAAVERAGGVVDHSILIGDPETDLQTARAVGVPCALVTFGPDGRGVAEMQPEALLDDFGGLSALVARHIG